MKKEKKILFYLDIRFWLIISASVMLALLILQSNYLN